MMTALIDNDNDNDNDDRPNLPPIPDTMIEEYEEENEEDSKI